MEIRNSFYCSLTLNNIHTAGIVAAATIKISIYGTFGRHSSRLTLPPSPIMLKWRANRGSNSQKKISGAFVSISEEAEDTG